MPPTMETCPILVWMLSMNRSTTKEDYDQCYQLVQNTMSHVRIKYAPDSPDSFLQIVSHMMPLLMMRHRRVPRAMWRDRQTEYGKHWIEQDPASMQPDKYLKSMIGYNLAYDTSLIGMAMVQGHQREVVNIGLGMTKLAVQPEGVPVAQYVESMKHKITPLEFQLMAPEEGNETMLRRLCILLALKSSYIKAIGQPMGFDWSRVEFNIPKSTASADGAPLQGWEFRVFNASLGVFRGADGQQAPPPHLVEEKYVCAVAFFRGLPESKFEFQETNKDLESWVQFINIDQMLKVVPKLMA